MNYLKPIWYSPIMGLGTSIMTSVTETAAVVIEDYMFESLVAYELTPKVTGTVSDFHDTWDLDGTDYMPEALPDDEGYWDIMPELVTNGQFDANTNNWGNALINTNPTLSWNSGKARISNTTGSNYNTGLNTTNDPLSGISGQVKVTGNIQIISGSTGGSWTINEPYGTSSTFTLGSGGDFSVIMTADGTSNDIAIYVYASNIVFEIDNISVTEFAIRPLDV